MTTRRSMLAGLAAAVTGVAGLALGSGAYTQTNSDRDLTLVVSNDDGSILAIEPSGVDSNVVNLDERDGRPDVFTIDGDMANVGTTLVVGRVQNVDFDDPEEIVEEAFTITNNGGGTVDVSASLDVDGDVDIKIALARELGQIDAEATEQDDGTVEDVESDDELFGVVLFESSGVDPDATVEANLRIEALESGL